MKSIAIFWALLLAFFWLNHTRAFAASFDIKPVEVFLTARDSVTFVTLRNLSDKKIRFQIKLYAWNESPEGKTILSPTDEVVYFPRLLSLNPEEKRLIRIGTQNPLTITEKTYRIFVTQLPEGTEPVNGTQVRMMIAFSTPIFLLPPKQIIEGKLEDIHAEKGIFSFVVRNTGNSHFQTSTVVAKGYDAQKKVIYQEQLPAWYVLAGGYRAYHVKLPEKDCARIMSMNVNVKIEETFYKQSGTIEMIFKDLQQTYQMPPGACKK